AIGTLIVMEPSGLTTFAPGAGLADAAGGTAVAGREVCCDAGGRDCCARRHAAGHSKSAIRGNLICTYNNRTARWRRYPAGSISADIEPFERSRRQSGP